MYSSLAVRNASCHVHASVQVGPIKAPTMTCPLVKSHKNWCWQRQSHACSVLALTWRHKNGPWLRTLPYQEPMPGLSLCVGVSFPVSVSMTALLSLFEVRASHGTWPTLLLHLSSSESGWGLSTAAQGEACRQIALHQASGETDWP